MYLTGGSGRGMAVVGSSNFTRSGLGGGSRPNLEINLATSDAGTRADLCDWFDELWQDPKLTTDVKQEVLDALARIGQEQAPEFIYFKTLFELFRHEIDARLDSNRRLDDIHLYDSQIWKAMYEFQRDGARSVISRLRQYNGCILADSVGLGKTYTVLASSDTSSCATSECWCSALGSCEKTGCSTPLTPTSKAIRSPRTASVTPCYPILTSRAMAAPRATSTWPVSIGAVSISWSSTNPTISATTEDFVTPA